MNKFFVVVNDKKEGPYSVDELLQKDITANTLVWSEGFVDWTEAKEVVGLKEFLTKIPPPIPNQTNFIQQQAKEKERIVAKELKAAFKLFLLGCIVGITSYPVFYYLVYAVPKYDSYDYGKLSFYKEKNCNYCSISIFGAPRLSDFPFSCRWIQKEDVVVAIERRRIIYTNESQKNSVYIVLLTGIVLIGGRYLFKGVSWVNRRTT